MTSDKHTPPVKLAPSEILAEDLRISLANALLFTSDDWTLPVLSGLHLEFSGKAVTVAATDRYTLGVATAPCRVRKGQFLLDKRDAKELIGLLKARQSYGLRATVTLTIADSVRTLTVALDGITVTYGGIDGAFPKWRSLLDLDKGDVVADHFYNPRVLALLAKIQPKADYAAMSFGSATKPFTATLGDRMTVLVMPVRPKEAEA